VAAEPSIHVLFEPAARPHADLAGVTAVVIDAVRATTTVVAALAAGCVEVLPFRTAEEVLAEAARRPPGTVVTAGERLGVRIDGLDLNNSPSVMTPDTVAGRTLLLTTTNGTAAVLDALAARDVLVAAMPNRAAVARRCAALGRRVVFVTAGTVGTVSCEDTLVAGAVIDAMSAAPGGGAFHLADSARTALLAWLGARDCLADVLHRTWGGAFIARLGLDADLAACAALDTSAIVPVAHAMPTRITAS
jgi:2-phosphosulfolactate phosphatase